jgi:hypothetical protein
MQKLFNFLMVGLTFVVLNVATVAAQAEINPLESNTPPEQQEEMSEVVNATDGGTMSAAADAGAEADRLAAAAKEKRCKDEHAQTIKHENYSPYLVCMGDAY